MSAELNRPRSAGTRAQGDLEDAHARYWRGCASLKQSQSWPAILVYALASCGVLASVASSLLGHRVALGFWIFGLTLVATAGCVILFSVRHKMQLVQLRRSMNIERASVNGPDAPWEFFVLPPAFVVTVAAAVAWLGLSAGLFTASAIFSVIFALLYRRWKKSQGEDALASRVLVLMGALLAIACSAALMATAHLI